MCTIAAFFLNEMQYLELLNQINSCAAKPENFHSTEVDGPARRRQPSLIAFRRREVVGGGEGGRW